MHHHKRRVFVTFLLLALLWLIAWIGARWLIVSAPLAQGDAIVVMAGSTTYEERTQRAAELYTAGRANKIILTNDNEQSGWSAEEQRNIPFHELASRALRRHGVPGNAIETLSEPVTSTYDEALLLRKYAEAHDLRSLLIVTSAYHSRRVLWTMRQIFRNSPTKIGLELVPPGQQTPSPATWWLHYRGWQLVVGEHMKMVYYLLRFH
jgi:uncharacterized SAM-binding protein YcdF (DUF218 family)